MITYYKREDLLEKLCPGQGERKANGICPTCGKEITPFRNKLSAKEFTISGMCQLCQDSVFGKD